MLFFRPREVLERDAGLAGLTKRVEESIRQQGLGLGKILATFPDQEHQACRLGRAYLSCLKADHDALADGGLEAREYQNHLEALLEIAQEGQGVAFLAYAHSLSLVSNMLPTDYLMEKMTLLLEEGTPDVQLLMELLVICDSAEELCQFEGRVYREAMRRFPTEFADWYDDDPVAGPRRA